MEYLSNHKQTWLPWFLRGTLFLGMAILLVRLVDLQIIRGSYFKTLAEGNRLKKIPIEAPRGKILARGGEDLAINKEVKKQAKITSDGIVKTEIFDSNTDNQELITEYKREYKGEESFGHVVGYVSETKADEVGKIRGSCPEKGIKGTGELTGRTGLEEQYECELSGLKGERLIEIDAQGKWVRTIGSRDPVKGSDIKTNIHFGLQKKVSELMKGKKGSVVVSDGKGQILAIYSSPSFDPNSFVNKNSQEISNLLNNPDLPLFNRAIAGTYHPGSVFKPFVAIAGLEKETFDENFSYYDVGFIKVNDFTYNNWYFTQYGGTEGEIKLERALARSTDTYFYKIGEMMGPDAIKDYSHLFGLDEKTGIDLPGEVTGLVPSPDWKQKTKGEKWFLGNTYHLAIGQGDLAVTPIALNAAISAIASRGSLCNPRIVGNPDCKKISLREENIQKIIDGMKGACSSGGTGYTFFDFKEGTGKREGPSVSDGRTQTAGQIDVACKTGTAQTGGDENSHAWFEVFAPVNNPEIVATVLVEKGGEGSKVAGPIAREIFNYWFGLPSKEIKEVESE